MALVSQSVPNLLGGVSQRNAAQRDASECSEQINLIADVGRGLRTRPPSVLSATLSAVPTAAYDSVHEHDVVRSATDRYRIILSDGDLKVFDAVTGVEQTVQFPDGKAYLDCTSAAEDFRCVTVGDVTYIVNKTIATARGTETSDPIKYEALVSIRQADFGTTYSITLNDATVSFTTVPGFSPSDRIEIATETIATKLFDLIAANASMADFTIRRYGSTLYITRTDGADFNIEASDGLADEGIRAIKGSVQRFDDLPERAKHGFVVEITGDPDNQFDNYFVRYDDNGVPNLAGVWKETVKPGSPIALDAATFPHILTRGSQLVDGVESGGVPSLPKIGGGSSVAFSDSFDTLDHADNTHADGPEDSNGNLVLFGSFATPFNLTFQDVAQQGIGYSQSCADFDGNSATVTVNFMVDTKACRQTSILELWLSTAPSTTPVTLASYTKVATKAFRSGLDFVQDSISYTGVIAANTRVQLRLTTAETDLLRHGPVFTMFPDAPATWFGASRPAGIVIDRSSGTAVTFSADTEYPEGCVITLTVEGTDYPYTALEGDTGTDIAIALAALVAGGYTATSPEDGLILIVGNPVPDVSVSVSFSSSTTFYSPALALTADELVGETLNNLTDGSTGTITSNTTNTITVAALTGGATNTFTRGDICTVTGASTTQLVFQEALWKKRTVGNTITIPWPSFLGKTLDEIFFDKNRLGLISKGKVVMSQSGDSLNLFRQSATKLLPDDPIDVQAVSTRVANFHSAVHFDERTMLWSSNGQSVLDGQPNLTPETISITPKTDFVSTTKFRPVVAGSKLFFARANGDSTQVMEYSIVNETGTMDADDITKHIPTYIAGAPIAMVADSSLGFLALLTDDDQSKLYICNYAYASQTRVQNAWGKWDFGAGATIVSMGIMDSVLSLVVKRSTGVYIETVDLDPAAAGTTGNDAGGSAFNWSYTFSTIYKRSVNRDGRTEVDNRGRLAIRRIMLQTHDSGDMTATVTLQGRSAIAYTHDGATSDEFRFPIMGRNLYATIVLSGTSADAAYLDGFDWEGSFEPRSSRV